MGTSENIVMLNGHFITNEARESVARAVALSDGKIVAVGNECDVKSWISTDTRVINCQNFVVIPGFIDAHMHPFSQARNKNNVNCDHYHASSVKEIISLLREQASHSSANEWVIGYGYDYEYLPSHEILDRRQLDLASVKHPIKLIHRSGHMTIMNSKALEFANINCDTPDPISGVIGRYDGSNIPNGILIDCEGFIRDRLGHTMNHQQFFKAMASTNESLAKRGITSIQDAGYTNNKAHWNTFVELIEANVWTLKTTMMVGLDSIEDFNSEGLTYASSRDLLRVGHAKIMLGSTTGSLIPSQQELHYQVSNSHQLGFPVAIHAVEAEAVEVAAEVLTDLHKGRNIPFDHYDRIEHCSEAPKKIIDKVANSHAMVVTQPGFLYWRREQYRATVDQTLQPDLYPVHELARKRIPYAFSSDAPVIDPNPWCGIDAILNGAPPFNRGILPTSAPIFNRLQEAIYPYTMGGAFSENTNHEKGSIALGKKADLAIFPWTPGKDLPSPESHYSILTMRDGVILHDELTL